MISINVVMLPYRFGIGDHKIILVNFKCSNVSGHIINICSPGIWRLIYDKKLAVEKYLKKSFELL